jgi:hypothetical protein
MTSLRRVTSTMMVLALLMALTAVPALAAVTASSAITSGDLLSGQGGQISLQINNTGAAAGLLGLGAADSPINAIQIEAPIGVFETSTVALPDNWSGGYDAEIGFVFATADDEEFALQPGASFNVTLNGTALRIPDDSTRNVPVFVSSNNGTTLTTAGTPAVTSRILEVVTTTVAKPVAATNASPVQVTAQQDNVSITVGVVNHGSVSRNVNVAVTKVGGSSGISAVPAVVQIAPTDGTAEETFNVTFGGAGTLDLDATASSTSSAAKPLRMATITVQPKFAGTYVTDSLSPRTVVQGSDVSFSLRLNKQGTQPASLATTFSFTGFTVTKAVDFTAGNTNNTTIIFPETTVDANLLNEEYVSTLTAVGVDGNGALVDVTLTPQTVTLDNLLPVVNLLADVGSSAVANATPAAGNGRTIQFSGTVKIGTGPGADPCSDCTVTRAVLVTNDGTELAFALSNSGGSLGGSSSFTFPAGTSSARAEITVEKVSGLLGSGTSNVFEVDIIAPVIGQALTQRDGSDDTVLVTMAELVDLSGTTAQDWSVDNNFVTGVSPVGDDTTTTQIVLELAQPFDSTNANPAVSYVGFGLNARPFDRVALDLLDQVIEATDGINPLAPVIDLVAGFGLQDGEFWTNDSTPTVSLSSLVVGDTIKLYYDTNDDEKADPGEQIFAGVADDSTAEVAITTDLGSIETVHELIAIMVDEGFNASPLASKLLNLDYTTPKLIDLIVDTTDGNLVTAVFDEPVARGRNAAFDWTVQATQDGELAYRTVTSVEFLSPTERLLRVSTASYDSSKGAISGIRFKFRGASEDRYEDRATNELGDVLYID